MTHTTTTDCIAADVLEFQVDDFWYVLDRARREKAIDNATLANLIGVNWSNIAQLHAKMPRRLTLFQAMRFFRVCGWSLSLTITRNNPAE